MKHGLMRWNIAVFQVAMIVALASARMFGGL
jgi:hypothetical protein